MEARAVRLGLRDRGAKVEDRGSIGIRARLLDSVEPSAEVSIVILCGLAGALHPELRVGDLVLDVSAELEPHPQVTEYLTAETQRRGEGADFRLPLFSASQRLRGAKSLPSTVAGEKHFGGLRRGRIYTSAEIVPTPEEKAALFQSTGADAVDMEQSIVKQWCDRRGLALVGLRAISDTASQALDPAVIGFVDDLGRPRPAKIAAALARQPSLIPHLIRLNADAKLALKNLAAGVRAVVDAMDSVS